MPFPVLRLRTVGGVAVFRGAAAVMTGMPSCFFGGGLGRARDVVLRPCGRLFVGIVPPYPARAMMAVYSGVIRTSQLDQSPTVVKSVLAARDAGGTGGVSRSSPERMDRTRISVERVRKRMAHKSARNP